MDRLSPHLLSARSRYKGLEIGGVYAGAFQIDSFSEQNAEMQTCRDGICFPSRHAYATTHATNLAATLRRWFIEPPRQQLTTPGRARQERLANRVAEQLLFRCYRRSPAPNRPSIRREEDRMPVRLAGLDSPHSARRSSRADRSFVRTRKEQELSSPTRVQRKGRLLEAHSLHNSFSRSECDSLDA